MTDPPEKTKPTPGIIRFLQKSKETILIVNKVMALLDNQEQPVKKETIPNSTDQLTELLITLYRETETLAKIVKGRKFQRALQDIKKRIAKLNL